MAKFDLTSKMTNYLDRHLVSPLLEFLWEKKIYSENEILQAKLVVLNKTYTMDKAFVVYKRLNSDKEVPEEMKIRRDEIVSQLHGIVVRLQSQVNILMYFIRRRVMHTMEINSKTIINYLTKDFIFKEEIMEILYKFAMHNYDCGNYGVAKSNLNFYLLVMSPTDKNYLNVLWGKLASEILIRNWETALEDLNKLRECIDSNKTDSPLKLRQQRTWLIHCSLFVFFNHVIGCDLIIDMFLYMPK